MSRRRRPTGNSGRPTGPSIPRHAAPTGQAPADRRSRKANPPPAARRDPSGDFWGTADDPGPPVGRIRPTPDPAALPRSLGDPPLGPNPQAAQHHLAAVYEEAVRAAVALAAATGLLDIGQE